MKKFLCIVFLLLILFGCTSKTIKDNELHELVVFLSGEFSNEEQTKNDPGFALLHLNNSRIWEHKPDYWLYSEVHDGKKIDQIYGQRIIKYERVDSFTFKSTNYQIRNAKDYRKGWKNKRIFNKLTMDSLEIRYGCEVYYEKNTSTIYSGKTNKNLCFSSTPRVEYITTNFVISKDKISIWNRGYDNKGKQVWGKITGPYKYRRILNQ